MWRSGPDQVTRSPPIYIHTSLSFSPRPFHQFLISGSSQPSRGGSRDGRACACELCVRACVSAVSLSHTSTGPLHSQYHSLWEIGTSKPTTFYLRSACDPSLWLFGPLPYPYDGRKAFLGGSPWWHLRRVWDPNSGGSPQLHGRKS